MLMELADKGDLQSKLNGYLHLRKFIEEEQIWVIFFQVDCFFLYFSKKN